MTNYKFFKADKYNNPQKCNIFINEMHGMTSYVSLDFVTTYFLIFSYDKIL